MHLEELRSYRQLARHMLTVMPNATELRGARREREREREREKEREEKEERIKGPWTKVEGEIGREN